MSFPKNVNELKIAPLLLLPFVENAFKHGVSNHPGDAFVKIDLKLLGKNLLLNVENTRNESANKNYSKGIGLKNVKKRLQLMYPEKHILHIEQKEETFSVNLTVQLEQ